MQQTVVDQGATVTANEFREILDDISSNFRLLEPFDLEVFSYYLLRSLGSSGGLNGNDRIGLVRVIDDFLSERFPGYDRASWINPSSN
ncbi:MAG: hypothetical protein HY314_00875 [Acidobacteria bacterium]|nr:hypothetical protein [Acidobacteriota bacterium]